MSELVIFNWILIWIGLSVVVGLYSDRKGGSFVSGFLIALLVSPVLAGLFVAVRKPLTSEIEKRELASGEMKKCPACAELIRAEAVKCRFCGEDVSAVLSSTEQMQQLPPKPKRAGWQAFLYGKEPWN